MPNSEQALIEKCKEGDIASFERLIQQYQVYAYNIALRTLKHEEDAKDATQDALVKVFKNISQYTGDAQFSTWLYRVVMNTCKDYLRKKNLTNVVSIDSESEEAHAIKDTLVAKNDYQPEKQLERKLVKEQIESALDKLPDHSKSVIILRDIQGLSYEEISVIEDCSVGTVKSRINRARKYLRELLGSDLGFTEKGGVSYDNV